MSRTDQTKAMHEYLDALLFDQPEERPAAMSPAAAPVISTVQADTKSVERLLAQATVQSAAPSVAAQAEDLELEARLAAEMEAMRTQVQSEAEEVATPVSPPPVDTMENYRAGEFQALFFSVAGLNLAVPLKSLGGIHNWHEPNSIFGKPDWYLGMMTNREEKLNVVDTARWVMPEKYEALADSLDYQYLIMLGNSTWGLACESLVTTESLSPEDVQWRKEGSGKRPWLAGVVREKMCAILDVDAMVAMLDQGLSSQDS